MKNDNANKTSIRKFISISSCYWTGSPFDVVLSWFDLAGENLDL